MFRHARRVVSVGAAAVLAAIVLVPAATGGTGAGSVFNLGRTNSVNKATVLTGAADSRMLQVTNSGSGAALSLTTKTTVAPLKVNSSTKVANLNADKLDGLTSSDFMPAGAHPDAATLDGLSSSDFVRPRGETLISVGSGSWAQQNSGAGLTYLISTSSVAFRKATTGSQFVVAAPDLPVSTFGEAAELRGFQLCFENGTNTSVAAVELAVSTTTDAGATTASPINDFSVRTGTDCVLFTLPTPAVLAPTTKATLFVTVNWGVAGQDFDIRGLTFVLGPTGAKATPLIP